MSSPLITVVLSVHNDERYLPFALRSIRAQTLSDWRMIAVDDGSTDRSSEILDQTAREDSRVQVIHKPNTGMGDSLRVGLDQVETIYAARMDSDDLSKPTRLEACTSYLESNPDHVLVGTWAWLFLKEIGVFDAALYPDDDMILRSHLESGTNPVIHGSAAMRMSAYRQVVGYRPTLHNSNDLDLWLQLSERGKIGMHTDFAYCYQISRSSLTYARRREQLLEAEVAVRLARERRVYGREITTIDRKRIAGINNTLRLARDGTANQFWYFSIGFIHWSAGFKDRACRAFAKAIGPNWIGMRALWMIVQVMRGRCTTPMSNFKRIAENDGKQTANLDPPYPWAWASEWLREMGIPQEPYILKNSTDGRIA